MLYLKRRFHCCLHVRDRSFGKYRQLPQADKPIPPAFWRNLEEIRSH
ncbi:MAG: hypothetical protein DSM106950_44335 [Stigonema ocellatum SAG 48.90 = DSM 106950]|nr:hypothetical protein [Stigonema ocellatum SAG 48.90 = DSM 106950]